MSHRAIIRTVLLLLPAIFCMYSVVLADDKAEPSGTWRWERKLQERTLKSTLKLKLVDGKLMGTYHGLGDEVAIESAKLDGDTLSFEVNREFNDQKFTIRFQGKIKGDKITGIVTVGDRELEWKASRSLLIADLLGTWQFKIETPNGQTITPSLKLKKNADKLVGVYTSRLGEIEATEIQIKGMQLSFKIAGERDGNKFSVVYTGKPEGDAIKGTIEYEFGDQKGSLEFEGKRQAESADK